MITNFYNQTLMRTENYLKESGYILEQCDKNDDEISRIIKNNTSISFRKFWKTKVFIKEVRDITLILAFPQTFPDTLPKIYLSEKDFQKIYPIPHLDKNSFICTRDPEVAIINETKVGEATKKLIEIATNIIKAGVKKEKQADYIEEFLAYWNADAKCTLLSIFAPKEQTSFLSIYKLKRSLFGYKYILTESRNFLEKWLAPFSVSIYGNEVIKVLYFQTKSFLPHLFNTDTDLLKIIDDQNIKNSVEHYFNQDKLPFIIIASFILNNEIILFGWEHLGWRNINIKGFRKKHVPLRNRLNYSKENLIKKIKIIRLDKQRLLKRGGLMSIPIKEDISIAILGCGSLGSFLTMSFARCGINEITLVDKERISPENTPRHLCGLVEASKDMYKVDAVKEKILKHFPYIACKVFHEDILNLLEKDNKFLNNITVILVAIGNRGVERRINYMLKNGLIKSPIIYLWVEPLGVGGHILYINPKNGGCYDSLFDENGNFHYSISKSSDYFYKREGGCQSTFMPYSALTVEQFSIIASKTIIKLLDDFPKNSVLFTWLGDIEDFEKSGHSINPMYEAQLPNNIIKRQIT